MDDFAAAPALGYTQFAAGAEDYLARESDVLVSVTPHTARTLERFGKHAHVVPNGIEVNYLNAPRGAGSRRIHPDGLRRGEITLGFWGTLMDSLFDAELVAQVAAARPQWMIHLLGATDPEPHRPSVRERLKSFPNVIFHGAVPHAELPHYAAAFDVALAPFPDNDFGTRARSDQSV